MAVAFATITQHEAVLAKLALDRSDRPPNPLVLACQKAHQGEHPVDRAIKSAELFGLPGNIDKWKRLRAEIHAEVCEKGYDTERNTFTQYYGSKALDASLLATQAITLEWVKC